MADNNEKKPTFKERVKESFCKLKKIKNIELIICIILIAVILLVYGLVKEAEKKKDEGSSNTQVSGTAEKTEAQKLGEVLSDIKGAGEVSVYISYDGSGEKIYAYDSKKNTTVREDNSGGEKLTTTVTEEESVPVFVTEGGVKTPLVVRTESPKILGVVIVAEGANDLSVKLQLMKAASSALGISEKIIEIFIMK